ncbi:MAG: hypothetical protein PHH08_02570 [Candidatus ainarchaeum sp.]|nr:hypothetical protein [Candidatus ainarchaeum sp.]
MRQVNLREDAWGSGGISQEPVFQDTKMKMRPGRAVSKFGHRFARRRRGRGPDTIATAGLKVKANEYGLGPMSSAEQMLRRLRNKGKGEDPKRRRSV